MPASDPALFAGVGTSANLPAAGTGLSPPETYGPYECSEKASTDMHLHDIIFNSDSYAWYCEAGWRQRHQAPGGNVFLIKLAKVTWQLLFSHFTQSSQNQPNPQRPEPWTGEFTPLANAPAVPAVVYQTNPFLPNFRPASGP